MVCTLRGVFMLATMWGGTALPGASPNEKRSVTQPISVRLAQPGDAAALALLLVEGFGHEYGGVLGQPAGRRALERSFLLPGRLQGVAVATNADNEPVGMAALRTSDMYSGWEHQEQLVLHQELGLGKLLQLELLNALVDPLPYHVRRNEGFVYSVAVTSAWRRQGVAGALMEFLHNMARERGKTVMVLEVTERNIAARRLYERHDYRVRQRRRGLLAWLPWGASPRLLLEKRL